MIVGKWSVIQPLNSYLLKIAPQVLEGRSLVSGTTAVHVGTRVAGLRVVQRVDGYLPKARVAGVRSWTGRDRAGVRVAVVQGVGPGYVVVGVVPGVGQGNVVGVAETLQHFRLRVAGRFEVGASPSQHLDVRQKGTVSTLVCT